MLFGSTILEVAIGMIFVYLLLSLLCSAVNEYIEAKLNYRAKYLREGIKQLLDGDNQTKLAEALYAHPLVRGLYRGNKLPSYIPSRTFALALWNQATSAATGLSGATAGVTTQLQSIRQTISTSDALSEGAKTALLTLIDEAGGNLDRARENIEDWYDDAMDRVSGWYKRRVQIILLIIGFAVSAAINADTINIGQALVKNDALRKALVGEAEKTTNAQASTQTQQGGTPQEQAAAAKQRMQDLSAQLNSLGLPIGWKAAKDEKGNAINTDDARRRPDSAMGWLLKAIGILLTALAISQGAPFWFDLLNKFMVIRSTVKPREKSREQPSKDKPAPKTEVETNGEDDDGKSKG
ncbi:MAG TPA: hypothetical protein VGB73_17780 [Pyrinomonadaceae bacterium]|jgi:hypothetical protein